MAPQKKSPPYDQVLKLVEQMPSKEQERLRLVLDRKARHHDWRALVKTIAEANKGRPPISDEEILAEVKAAKILS